MNWHRVRITVRVEGTLMNTVVGIFNSFADAKRRSCRGTADDGSAQLDERAGGFRGGDRSPAAARQPAGKAGGGGPGWDSGRGAGDLDDEIPF